MKKQLLLCLSFLTLSAINSLGQSKDKIIDSLKELVDRNAKEAIIAKKEADRIRCISIGQALAEISPEVKEDQLSALLALQAYNFNKQNYGYEHDRKIYGGLISALSRFDSTQLKPISFSNSVVAAITLSKTNSMLVVEKSGRIIRWINQNEKWQSEELNTRTNVQVISAAINKDESVLVLKIKSEKANIQVEIYDLNNLKKAKAIVYFDSDVKSILLTPDRKGLYALTNSRKSIVFCDFINTKTVITSSDAISVIDISSDGKTLAGIGSHGNLYTWDTQNYSLSQFQVEKDVELTYLIFTPMSKDLVIGNSSGQIKIFSNGITRRILQAHRAPVDQIVFDHIGHFAASLDRNKKILIWNWNDLNKRPQEIQEKGNVSSISFSPNDNQLISSASFRFWPLNISSFASKLCSFIKRNMTKEEWQQYVSDDIAYQPTCPNLPRNDK